ncbi:MAG: diguanylate cyclase [Culicoidibacterales bacterium]
MYGKTNWWKIRLNTFGVRLNIAFFIVSVIPILLIIAVAMNFLNTNVAKMIRKQSEKEKKQIVTIFNNRAYELERLGKSFARSSELYGALENGDFEGVDQYAKRILTTLDEIDGAIVYTPESEPIVQAFRDPVALELIVNPTMLQRTVGSSLYGQEVNMNYLANDGAHIYFVAIVQIQNNDPDQRKATGALVLFEKLDQSFLQSVLKNFRYQIAFINKDGEVEGPSQIKQFIKNNQITEEQFEKQTTITVPGSDRILIPIQKQIWAMISLEAITQIVTEISNVIKQVLLASLVISFIASSFLRFGMTRSITQLVRRLQKMKKNKQVTHLPLRGPMELQDVANEFNNLIESSNIYREQSVRDAMTNSYNKRYLEDYLQKIQEQDLPITLFFGDIDFFKKINDTYGHARGDAVICDVVRIFSDILGSKAVVSRYGGEEFVAIVPLLSPQAAKEKAEAIRMGMKQLTYTGFYHEVTISIGVSDTTQAQHVNHVIKQADEAMYYAKQNGRDQSCYYNCQLSKKTLE